MSAILWLGGAIYLLTIIQTAGHRYERDFVQWQAYVFEDGINTLPEKRLNIATAIQRALES